MHLAPMLWVLIGFVAGMYVKHLVTWSQLRRLGLWSFYKERSFVNAGIRHLGNTYRAKQWIHQRLAQLVRRMGHQWRMTS
jgi:hypothetical protein